MCAIRGMLIISAHDAVVAIGPQMHCKQKPLLVLKGTQ